MKSIKELQTIRPLQPDDLFVVCSSFEDRCLGSIKLLSNYCAKSTIIINFFSDSNVEGEKKKREATSYLLKNIRSIDAARMPRMISVGPYNYPELINEIQNELALRGIQEDNIYATIDISCFTKIQLLFLLKHLIEKNSTGKIRLIYTLPESYNTSGDKFHRLSIGFYRPISIPFKIRMRDGADILKKVAILQIGHEGERISSVWRNLEVNKILILNPTSDDKTLMKSSEDANSILLRRAKSGEPLYKVAKCDRLDINRAIRLIKEFCDQERKNGNTLVSIIPLGPKPLAIASLLCAISQENLSFEVSYAIPTGYNSEYSKGIREVFEYMI